MNALKTSSLIILLLAVTTVNAQFLDKLGKKAERAVERTVEKRVETETQKSTDRALDSVIDAPKKEKKQKKKKKKKSDENNVIGSPSTDSNSSNDAPAGVIVNSNFDFTPGNVVIFEDNFSRDNIGDFPAKWDANGSGELVTIDGEKWFRLGNKTTFIPMMDSKLPENYTIEFDLFTQGMDQKTSSQSMITLLLDDNSKFNKGKNWSMVELSPCLFISGRGVVEKVVNGERELRNEIGKDFRDNINKKARISIAVNKSRMRVWMNDNKIVDIPRLVANGASYFKIYTRGLRDPRNVDEVYIANFKIGKAGIDNRSKLLTEGRLSTNSILFNTGSATIKSGSAAVIEEVATAMKQVSDMRIKIVGHTDSDGTDDANLKLSKERANSVRAVLISQYGIDGGRIETEGQGEGAPISSNSSEDGKSQNRRVEFIKQ